MVVAAGIASNLINRIDPRYLAGVGTLLAAAALFGFSRLPVRHRRCPVTDGRGELLRPTSCPFIVLMAFGMGMTFVPLTLTAVHHLRDEDSGIGSGVLNTMQQVGGALGLALLVDARYPDDRPTGAPSSRAGPGRRRAGSEPDQAEAWRDRQPGLHRGRHRRVPARRDHDARRLA